MNSFSLATVLLDPPTALLFGLGVALFSTPLLLREPDRQVRLTLLLGAGWSILYGLSVSWFFFARPDWMFVYLLDTRPLPLALLFLVFLFVMGGLGAIGAMAGSLAVTSRRFALGWSLAVAALLLTVGLMGLQWSQYTAVGTFAEFHAGKAVPILEAKGFQLWLNVASAIGGGSAVGVLGVRLFQGFRRPK